MADGGPDTAPAVASGDWSWRAPGAGLGDARLDDLEPIEEPDKIVARVLM